MIKLIRDPKLSTSPLQLRFPESNSMPLGQVQVNEPAELWHVWEQPPLEFEHSSISAKEMSVLLTLKWSYKVHVFVIVENCRNQTERGYMVVIWSLVPIYTPGWGEEAIWNKVSFLRKQNDGMQRLQCWPKVLGTPGKKHGQNCCSVYIKLFWSLPSPLLPQAMLNAPAMILGVKGPSNQHCISGWRGIARICGVFLKASQEFWPEL